MKRLIGVLLLLTGASAWADGDSSVLLKALQFAEAHHDFGIVTKGAKVSHRFAFVNAGDTPLEGVRAMSACGCTVTQSDKQRYEPGEPGFVDVTLDTETKTGLTYQTIEIFVQGRERHAAELSIMARVEKAP